MLFRSSQSKTSLIAESGIIAALYAALTALTWQFSGSVIQFRLSEALTVLPVLTPAAVPGLAIGCLAADLITACAPLDTVIGTAATLSAALLTRALRKKPYLSVLPPILINASVLPVVFLRVYGMDGTYPYFFLSILISETVSAGLLGTLLLRRLIKRSDKG